MKYTPSGGTALLDPARLIATLGVTAGTQVADFGCGGNGHFVFPLAQVVGREGTVYAVDVRREVLAAVEQKTKDSRLYHIETRWADLEKPGSTKIPVGSLDTVMIVNVLFQNPEPATIVDEARRVLKSGGKLMVIDWKKQADTFGPPTEKRLDPETVKRLGEERGLTLERVFTAGPRHYGIIFRKT